MGLFKKVFDLTTSLDKTEEKINSFLGKMGKNLGVDLSLGKHDDSLSGVDPESINTMERILNAVARKREENWQRQPEKNKFLIDSYNEGDLFIKYSRDKDYDSNSNDLYIYIEFVSPEFEDRQKADKMMDVIKSSGVLHDPNRMYEIHSASVNRNNTITYCGRIIPRLFDGEDRTVNQVYNSIIDVMNSVVKIKWPTHSEIKARKAAELQKQRNAEFAALKAEVEEFVYSSKQREAERSQKIDDEIKECKLNIAEYKAEITRLQTAYKHLKSTGNDGFAQIEKSKLDAAKIKLADEKYRLEKLKASR